MKIAILGCGRMGSALARGMIAAKAVSARDITLSSSSEEKAQRIAGELGTSAASGNGDALNGAEVVLLCVKPAKALAILRENSPLLAGKLIISVVAGLRADDLSAAAGPGARIIRSMPNTAVRLRRGITAVAPHGTATPGDLETAVRLFSSVGSAVIVREEDLDAVTAVSGSGPAFALLMLESLMQGAIEGGIPDAEARIFASGALEAAAALVSGSQDHPLALRNEITSPGGTTSAGLSILEEGDFTGIVRRAVRAARLRSQELSQPLLPQ